MHGGETARRASRRRHTASTDVWPHASMLMACRVNATTARRGRGRVRRDARHRLHAVTERVLAAHSCCIDHAATPGLMIVVCYARAEDNSSQCRNMKQQSPHE